MIMSVILFPFKILSVPAKFIAGILGVIFCCCVYIIIVDLAMQVSATSIPAMKQFVANETYMLITKIVVSVCTIYSAYKD